MPQSAAPAHGPNDVLADVLADVIPFPRVAVADEPAPDVHVHTIECSPLYATHGARVGWHGQIVTDPETIAAIRRRVEAGASGRGAWRRVLRRIRAGR